MGVLGIALEWLGAGAKTAVRYSYLICYPDGLGVPRQRLGTGRESRYHVRWLYALIQAA